MTEYEQGVVVAIAVLAALAFVAACATAGDMLRERRPDLYEYDIFGGERTLRDNPERTRLVVPLTIGLWFAMPVIVAGGIACALGFALWSLPGWSLRAARACRDAWRVVFPAPVLPRAWRVVFPAPVLPRASARGKAGGK